MSTDTEIFNRALAALDELEKQITSVTADTSPNGKLALLFYAKTREEELRLNPWTFAVKRQLAVASVATNNTGWLYSYTVPTDSLRVIGIYERDTGYLTSDMDHEGELYYHHIVEKGIIYTNAIVSTNLFVKYIERITDPTLFDPNFEEAFVLRLAGKLCKSVTGDVAYRRALQDEYGALLLRARAENALEAEDDSEAEGDTFWTDRSRV